MSQYMKQFQDAYIFSKREMQIWLSVNPYFKMIKTDINIVLSKDLLLCSVKIVMQIHTSSFYNLVPKILQCQFIDRSFPFQSYLKVNMCVHAYTHFER